MRKILSIISCALFLSAASMAFSQDFNPPAMHKDAFKIRRFHGSFVGTSGTTADDAVLRQFLFNEDRTFYTNSSNQFVFPISTGTFIAPIGTWETAGKKHIVATAVGSVFNSTGTDLNIGNNARYNFRFKVLNKDQVLLERFVTIYFNLDQNPLTDVGTVISDTNPNLILNRVQVVKINSQS